MASLSVGQLKDNLAEVLRRVECGELFEIKDGDEPVAVLAPHGRALERAKSLEPVCLKESLDGPPHDWTFDATELESGPRASLEEERPRLAAATFGVTACTKPVGRNAQ